MAPALTVNIRPPRDRADWEASLTAARQQGDETLVAELEVMGILAYMAQAPQAATNVVAVPVSQPASQGVNGASDPDAYKKVDVSQLLISNDGIESFKDGSFNSFPIMVLRASGGFEEYLVNYMGDVFYGTRYMGGVENIFPAAGVQISAARIAREELETYEFKDPHAPTNFHDIILYNEVDANRRAVKGMKDPSILTILFYDQNRRKQAVVYPPFRTKDIDWDDQADIDVINKWRWQWIARKTISKRFGRNGEDEWSLEESKWLKKTIKCILEYHRRSGHGDVFDRILWEMVAIAFDHHFGRPENHQDLGDPLAKESVDQAPLKVDRVTRYARRSQLPSNRIAGIMTVDQIQDRATALLNVIKDRPVTSAELRADNWSRFLRPLEAQRNKPKLKKEEIRDGLGGAIAYKAMTKKQKATASKPKGKKEHGKDEGTAADDACDSDAIKSKSEEASNASDDGADIGRNRKRQKMSGNGGKSFGRGSGCGTTA